MKWVYVRGSSLLPLSVGVAVVGGFLWQLIGGVAQPSPSVSLQPVDLAEARGAAHLQMRSGLILEGATTVLDALRMLPLDHVEEAAEVEASLQLLSFCMVALMPDDMLVPFHDGLDESRHAIDSLVLIEFYKEFRDYSSWRTVLTLDKDSFHAYVDSAIRSDAPLVRLEALRTHLDPAWTADPNDIPGMITAMNAMAEEFPDNYATREAFRTVLRTCSGRAFDHPEAANMLLNAAPWNNAMQSLIATDSVAAVVQDAIAAPAAAKTAGIPARDPQSVAVDVLTSVAETSEDAAVRDWCLRSLASTASVANQTAQTLTPEIAACIETVAATDLEPLAKTTQPVVVASDVARAQFLLFANAIEEGDLAAAAPFVDLLWDQERIQQLPDTNLYERIPRKFGYYGYALVGQGQTNDAIAFFERLATLYPSSYLAQDHLNTATFLRQAVR